MNWIDIGIEKTMKGFLILFGLATCLPLFMAMNLPFSAEHLFGGWLDYTPSSVPGLRHWGMMVFGIGVLMITSAFRPQLRFETMVYSTIEKAFMVYLYVSNLEYPWVKAYTAGIIVDSIIVVYSLFYFVSRHGKPQQWVQEKEANVQ